MGATPRQIERVYRCRYSGFVGAMTAVVKNPDDAADVVQDGFAQALARRRDFRGDGALEAWIWKIVLRKAFDRSAAPQEPASLEELPDSACPTRRLIPTQKALRQLTPRKRLVVYLHYVADLPYPTVAEICGISEGTVAATLSQARAALAESLAERRPETARTVRGTR